MMQAHIHRREEEWLRPRSYRMVMPDHERKDAPLARDLRSRMRAILDLFEKSSGTYERWHAGDRKRDEKATQIPGLTKSMVPSET